MYGVANGAPRSKEAFLQTAHDDGRVNLCNGPGWVCRREHTPRRHPFLPIFPPPRQEGRQRQGAKGEHGLVI